jgi:hypothetical protein
MESGLAFALGMAALALILVACKMMRRGGRW